MADKVRPGRVWSVPARYRMADMDWMGPVVGARIGMARLGGVGSGRHGAAGRGKVGTDGEVRLGQSGKSWQARHGR
jgi:hypothetical protein